MLQVLAPGGFEAEAVKAQAVNAAKQKHYHSMPPQ
jgi:hypothetical protein